MWLISFEINPKILGSLETIKCAQNLLYKYQYHTKWDTKPINFMEFELLYRDDYTLNVNLHIFTSIYINFFFILYFINFPSRHWQTPNSSQFLPYDPDKEHPHSLHSPFSTKWLSMHSLQSIPINFGLHRHPPSAPQNEGSRTPGLFWQLQRGEESIDKNRCCLQWPSR